MSRGREGTGAVLMVQGDLGWCGRGEIAWKRDVPGGEVAKGRRDREVGLFIVK